MSAVSYTEVDETCFDDGKIPFLAAKKLANISSVSTVLSKPVGPDGRSDWQWIRLPNGDLILGVYPCGDTYLAVEDAASF